MITKKDEREMRIGSSVLAIVKMSCNEVDPKFDLAFQFQGSETPLFGPGGIFDSLDLVRMTIYLEQAIRVRFDVSIQLANEKAMSQENSPFLTVQSLFEYTVDLVYEELWEKGDVPRD